MTNPHQPDGYVRPKRKAEPPDPNVLPDSFAIPAVLFAASFAAGGSVLLGRAVVWWAPIAAAAIMAIGSLLISEPWPRRFAFAITTVLSVVLSYATVPVFMRLYEWDWYERHFNDKGSGPLGFFAFTLLVVGVSCIVVFRALTPMLERLFPTRIHGDG
ncbi:hypothetical protein [Novipirellula caenicola]|uniref:Transmembrane protein n=1 Tax=Novipirellula caenicola TaxID=1536901 RepID=A0ABP9W1D1_9BACT